MKQFTSNLTPWIVGIAICFAGVLMVRLPIGADQHWIFDAAGRLLAGVGLLCIALGVGRRVSKEK